MRLLENYYSNYTKFAINLCTVLWKGPYCLYYFLDLAIIGDSKCYCTSYSTHDVVLELFENSLDNPCADNDTMDCGSSAYVSIYHIHEEFGHNFGYKFWQVMH